MEFIIGVDLGTTSTKVVLFDLDGQVHGYANKLYPLYQELPDMAEEDPEEIFQAVLEGIREVVQKTNFQTDSIRAVSFSSAMHSLIALDENYQPLTRVLTWADNRAEQYASDLKASGIGQEIYAKTGTPIHPMAPLAKLLWLKAEKTAIYQKAAHYMGIKEYVFYRLLGVNKVDYSIANAMGIFNIFNMDWDEQALELTGITPAQLPELVAPTDYVCGLKPELAQFMNLPIDVPFVFGASDGTLSNLGVNAIKPGVVAVTIGTSGAVRVVTDKPVIDPKCRTFTYYLDKDMWVVGGPVNNGGVVFRWARDNMFDAEKSTAKLLGLDAYDLLTDIAAKVPAGADGLIFHPYLGGERAPIWDANARGSFFGLTQKHTRAHMLRAVLEGIVYNLYSVTLALEEVVGKPTAIQATGGFARSALWRQMLADVYEQPVTIPDSFESSALGAAVVAMKALGIINSYDIMDKVIGATKTYQPEPANYAAYRDLMPIYIRLDRQLKSEYEAIADYQRKHVNAK